MKSENMIILVFATGIMYALLLNAILSPTPKQEYNKRQADQPTNVMGSY
jgi:hypothetical protein